MSIGYSMEASAMRRHKDKLRALPDVTKRELRKSVRASLTDIARTAKANASWSSRIPGAINTSVRLSGSVGGYVRVNTARAPHARPYEGITGGSTFRHPVYGGPAWVTQSTRPFLVRAAAVGLPKAAAGIAAAVETALKSMS